MASRRTGFAGRARLVIVVAALGSACARSPVPPDPATLEPLDPAVRALLDEVTGVVSANRSDASAWGRLGMALEANGFLPDAGRAYDTAIALDEREAMWRYRRALLVATRGEGDAALEEIDRVIVLAPDYAPARWRRGLWLLDRGDTAAAEAAFRDVLRARPDDPAGSTGLALVHLATGNDLAAATVLESLLHKTPGDRYVQHLAGTAYRRLGREEEARFALTVGATGQPAWPDPWSDEVASYRRGFAAMLKEATRLGLERRFDQAIALLRQLSALRPEDTALLVYLGGMYASAGRLNEAVAILDPIVAADPHQFDARMHLASGYLFTGDLDQAATYASQALSLRPSSADAAKLQGMVLWQQRRSRDAAAFFQAAADADPRDAMPHLWIGMMLGEQGRYLDARRRFELALSKNPLLGDALIGVADTLAATGDLAGAEVVIERAAQAEPGNPRLAAARDRIAAAIRGGR